MSVRSELEEFDLALTKLRHDLRLIQDKLRGPKWIFTRANVSRADSFLNAASGHIREAHSFVPTEMDTDG